MKKTYRVLLESPLLPNLTIGKRFDADDDNEDTKYLLAKKAIEVAPQPTALEEFGETIQQMFDAQHKSLLDAVSKAGGRPRVVPGQQQHLEDAQAHDKSLGEWMQCVTACGPNKAFGHDWHIKAMHDLENKYHSKRNPRFGEDYAKSHNMHAQAQETNLIAKASSQQESVGSLMGFIVPPEYSPEILRLTGMKSMFLDKVQRRRMIGLDLFIPVIDYSLGGSGADPFLAGMTGSWVAENQVLPQTNMKLRQLHLKANTFGAYAQETIQLLRDARNAETILTENFSKTAAFYWDLAIFSGSGVNQPVGMFSSLNPSSLAVNRSTGAGALLDNCAQMDAQLLPEEGSEGRAFWIASPSKFRRITTMNDPSGRIAWLPYYPGNDEGAASKRARLSILGYPVFKSQFPAQDGTSTDLVLVDPIGYVAAIREDIEVAASDQFAFTTYQMTYRFIMRGDGQPMLNANVTLQNNDVVSPFLYLN